MIAAQCCESTQGRESTETMPDPHYSQAAPRQRTVGEHGELHKVGNSAAIRCELFAAHRKEASRPTGEAGGAQNDRFCRVALVYLPL